MAALIITGICVVSLAIYLGAGFTFARLLTPRIAESFRYRVIGYTYPSIHEGPVRIGDRGGPELMRRKVAARQQAVIWGWPIALPMILMSMSMAEITDRYDPEVIKRQQERIKELETELGIGDRR